MPGRTRKLLFTAIVCLLVAIPLAAQDYTFELLAGPRGGYGSHDGAAAGFASPKISVAVGPSGDVYVADYSNNTIRKISGDGVVSTLAGLAGVAGSEDGVAGEARFSGPTGIAVDESGNVYVAEMWNHTIRKISPSGSVTTIAGVGGEAGNSDGDRATARFNHLQGLALGPSGSLYVFDNGIGSHRVRKIMPDGTVTTPPQPQWWLSSIIVGEDSTVYVADTTDYWAGARIRSISPAGEIASVAGHRCGGGFDGPAESACFSDSSRLAGAPDGTLYVADGANHVIRKISQGTVSTIAGVRFNPGCIDGTVPDALFFGPSSVAVDPNGTLYIGQAFAVRRVTSAGLVTTLAGTCPQAEHVDGAGTAARFRSGGSLALAPNGNVYVGDSRTLRRVSPDGEVITLAGHPDESAIVDGVGSAARFFNIRDAVSDSDSNIYVADTNAIRKITPGGQVTTLAGALTPGYVDGPGADARFDGVVSLAFAPDGNLYVSERAGARVRKVTLAGNVSTEFSGPTGDIGFDSGGNMYVATVQEGVYKRAPGGAWVHLDGPDYEPLAVRVKPDGTFLLSGYYRLKEFNSEGVLLRVIASGGNTEDDTTPMAGVGYATGFDIGPDNAIAFADRLALQVRIARPTTQQDRATASASWVAQGESVQLDASPAMATSFSWKVIQRAPDSAAEPSATNVRNPTFTPDAPGTYVLQLRAQGSGGTRYSRVTVHTGERARSRSRPVRRCCR